MINNYLGAKVRRFRELYNPYHMAFYIPHIWYFAILAPFLAVPRPFSAHFLGSRRSIS